jgi:hyperosmotically inducible protein
MKNILSGLKSLTAVMALAAVPMFGAADLAKQVRHELVMLPYYGVFDNLTYQVDNGVVTLAGSVTRPILKKDAEGVVKRLEGVTSVVNNIEVLPLSSFDDSIRLRAVRSVYGSPGFTRYAYSPNSPVKIIVKNGHVTLEGVVANENDKNLAFIKSSTVAGAFTVTNNLRVE